MKMSKLIELDELRQTVSYLEAQIKEDKQTSEEEYNKLDSENEYLMDKNLYLMDQVDDLTHKYEYQRRQKIESRKLIGRLKLGVNKLIKQNLIYEKILSENKINIEKSGHNCKLCYEVFDKDDYKNKTVFKCTNTRCGKCFHLDCILMVRNNKNKCPYCKVDYVNYNFDKTIDQDYLYESDEGETEIEYNIENINVETYRTYNLNSIIKIQSFIRKIIQKLRYQKDKEFLKLSKLALENAKKAYPNIDNLEILNINNPEFNEY